MKCSVLLSVIMLDYDRDRNVGHLNILSCSPSSSFYASHMNKLKFVSLTQPNQALNERSVIDKEIMMQATDDCFLLLLLSHSLWIRIHVSWLHSSFNISLNINNTRSHSHNPTLEKPHQKTLSLQKIHSPQNFFGLLLVLFNKWTHICNVFF